MKEAPGSSETSVLTRATRRNNPEDTILHSHRRENLKSYIERKRSATFTTCNTINYHRNKGFDVQHISNSRIRTDTPPVKYVKGTTSSRIDIVRPVLTSRTKTKQNKTKSPWSLVRKQTIPTERPLLLCEI
jgi:hypothetical protein